MLIWTIIQIKYFINILLIGIQNNFTISLSIDILGKINLASSSYFLRLVSIQYNSKC